MLYYCTVQHNALLNLRRFMWQLHYAVDLPAGANRMSIVRQLLARGASPNCPDGSGKSVLDVASQNSDAIDDENSGDDLLSELCLAAGWCCD